MTNKVNFDQDFVNAITGFQEKKMSHGFVTHINVGGGTVQVDADLNHVLSEIFPCILSKPIPATFTEPHVLHLRGEVLKDLSVRTFRDPIGW